MKKQKQDFSVLKKADSRTVEKISEICPVLNQNEQNRIFARSQAKYRHYQKAAEPYAEEEIFQAEPVKTSGIFMNFGAAAACLLVCAGTVGGGIYLTRHQKDFSASQSAEQLASETEMPTIGNQSETYQPTQVTEIPETTDNVLIIETNQATQTTKTTTVGTEPTEIPETTDNALIIETHQTTQTTTIPTVTEPTEIPAVTEPTEIPETTDNALIIASETTTETVIPDIPEDTAEPESPELTEPITETVPDEQIIPFSAQYIRNDQIYISNFNDFYLNHGGLTYQVVTSCEELEEQLSEVLPPYAKELGVSDYEKFHQKLEKYDTAFFENYDLIFIRKLESSGSFRHEVREVLIDSENDCTIMIDHHMPEFCTDDEAIWAICIETDKRIEQVNSINIQFNDVMHTTYPW